MSNAGQGVLTVVGTVVGAYFGYPQLGFALGSLAGQALFPTKLPTVSGPKLADFGQTQSSVGAAIPQGWGTCPATGNIIAQSDIREVIESDEVGGKGGPTQTVETPTYYQDFAIGFNDGEIAGVRRIWANGKLIYDRTPQASGESDAAFRERMAANDLLEEKMVVYFGTEDQEPDPTLEAFYGIGEVSAFRGLAYIVFINWYNKPEDGNKMPLSWRIEFFTSGSVTTSEGTEYSNEVLFPWLPGRPENPKNDHTFAIAASGYGAGGTDPIETTPISSVSEGIHVMESYRGIPLGEYQGVEATPTVLGGSNPGYLDSMGGYDATIMDWMGVKLHFSAFANSKAPYIVGGDGAPAGSNYCERLNSYLDFNEVTLTKDGYATWGIFTDTGNKQYIKLTVGSALPSYWNSLMQQCNGGDANEHIWLGELAGIAIQVTRVARAPDDPCAPFDGGTVKTLPGTDDFAIVDGALTKCGAWTLVSGTAKVMAAHSGGTGTTVATYPRNPCRPLGHAQYNDRAFWEEAYAEQVALGLMPAGLTYGVHYPVVENHYYSRESTFDTYETNPVALSDILHDLCIQSGYQESDFNVSDLATTYVIGFVRTGPMAARGCIEALRPIAMFDECEDQGVITFIKRGKGVVGTINDEDLGAFYAAEDGVDGKPPVSKITTTKLMDYDIPRQVRLHYLSYDRSYDAGEAPSPVRTDTDAVQTVDFDTTCILTDEMAAQVVQRIWADFWASRWQHTIYLDASSQQYKPTDCLAVPVDGQYQRMRIGSVIDKLPSVRQFEMVRDDSAAFISYAQGSEVPPQLTEVVTVNSPCEVVLLDLPPLRDQDDDSGIYAIAVPSLSDSTFKGATLMRSVDGGNYDRVANFGSGGTTGVIVTAPITDADPQIIDDESEMVITLPAASTLSSKTLAEVLAGANAAAIGGDGRWEIIQWQEAVLFGSTTWKLTGLLRGRRGTEHNIGTTVAGDQFVVLAQAIRVPLDITLVNKEMQYKCVATGNTLESADVVSFTGHGVALKPFSPCRVTGDRDPTSGAWSLEWLRRGRVGQTLQSGTDIALSEEVADYEIEILDEDSGVVRVLSVSAETANYSHDNQVVDFGVTQDTLRVNVYQMSTKVGRGQARFATLYAKQPYTGI